MKHTVASCWPPLRLGIVCALVLMGCGAAEVKVYKDLNSGSYVRKDFYPYEVAILPFTIDGEPSADKPDAILREVFYAHFSYLGYSDMPMSKVDQKLRDAGYTDPVRIASLSPGGLKELLGVDAAIKGHILNANNFTGGIYAETRFHARLLMVDLHTGDILWETEYSQRDQSSIASLTLVRIIQQQLQNVETQKAYYKVAEEFSVNILKKIPDPADLQKIKIHPPVISRLQTNLKPEQNLKADEVLKVTLLGPPGLTASYDIGNWKTVRPLAEIRPGVYTGVYKVLPEDQVSNALIIGRLTDQHGLIGKKVYKGATLTIEPSRNLTQADAGEPHATF